MEVITETESRPESASIKSQTRNVTMKCMPKICLQEKVRKKKENLSSANNTQYPGPYPNAEIDHVHSWMQLNRTQMGKVERVYACIAAGNFQPGTQRDKCNFVAYTDEEDAKYRFCVGVHLLAVVRKTKYWFDLVTQKWTIQDSAEVSFLNWNWDRITFWRHVAILATITL